MDYDLYIEKLQKQQLLDDPIKPGYVRIYTDHTGRFYEDVLEESLNKPHPDPFVEEAYNFLQKEIAAEFDKEIIKKILGEMKK